MRDLRYIKIGTENYPFPIGCEKYSEFNPQTGKNENKIDIIWAASEEDAFYLPTYREESNDEIYGMFLRKVISDPNLLENMTDVITRLDQTRTSAESKSYAYTPIGAPGNGKTYLMEAIGELVHPKGAFLVNCKNLREAEEIYKKSQIGVSKSSKIKAINTHVYMSNLGVEGKTFNSNTIVYMKSVLGNSICSQEKRIDKATNQERRITSIDWKNTDASADVIEKVCDEIIKRENIDYQEEKGNIGITTENGPLIEALFDPNSPDYGRILILDEYNRIQEGEGLLQIQAFFSEPGKKTLSLEGADGKSYTIQRDNIPATFLFVGTANQVSEESGESARRQSRPEISRQGQGIDIKYISDPSKEDYISRTLKHLTGVPAYYTFMLDPEYFMDNPRELSHMLKIQRTIGIKEEDIREIPKEEMFDIKHIDRTIRAATSFATFLYEADRCIQNLSKNGDLPTAYTDYLKYEAVVDLRYVYKLLQHSKIEKPKGKKGKDGKNAISLMGRKKVTQDQSEIVDEMETRIKHSYKRHMLTRGTKLEREISEKINSMFRPKDLSAKLKESTDIEGSYKIINDVVNGLNEIAKGLKYEFAGYIGEDSVAKSYNAKEEDFPTIAVEGIKNLLVASISETYGTKLSPEDITDDDALQTALSLLNEENDEKHIIVPNLDKKTTIDEPVIKVHFTNAEDIVSKETIEERFDRAISQKKAKHYDSELLITEKREIVNDIALQELERTDLLSTREFINSLCLRQMRKYNMKKLMQENLDINIEANANNQKAIDIATGKNDKIFTSLVLLDNPEKTGDMNETTGLAHIMYNKMTDYTIILSKSDNIIV